MFTLRKSLGFSLASEGGSLIFFGAIRLICAKDVCLCLRRSIYLWLKTTSNHFSSELYMTMDPYFWLKWQKLVSCPFVIIVWLLFQKLSLLVTEFLWRVCLLLLVGADELLNVRLTDWAVGLLIHSPDKNSHAITLDFHLKLLLCNRLHLSAHPAIYCQSIYPFCSVRLHPSIHLSANASICSFFSAAMHQPICPYMHTFLFVQLSVFAVFSCLFRFYLHVLGLSLKWNLSWSALLLTKTSQYNNIYIN